MDINEKAKMYAEGKVLETLTSMIEEAYASGYREGYNDGIAIQEPKPLVGECEGVEYVDLDLPSGTLWSSKYLYEGEKIKYLSYLEAAAYNIPTREQFDELLKYCECVVCDKIKRVLGKNANYIELYNSYIFKADKPEWQNHINFWLKKEDDGEEYSQYAYSVDKQQQKKASVFMGYKMPIMLVKTKTIK